MDQVHCRAAQNKIPRTPSRELGLLSGSRRNEPNPHGKTHAADGITREIRIWKDPERNATLQAHNLSVNSHAFFRKLFSLCSSAESTRVVIFRHCHLRPVHPCRIFLVTSSWRLSS